MAVKSGRWQKVIGTLREKKGALFKKYKKLLPCVTISGKFKTRKQLVKHSGLICIDVDKKDNPTLRVQDIVDKDCIAQFASCSGEGIKIIYKCKKVKTPAEHRRIYDAVVKRLNVVLKADPIVKSIASIQYVSYDPGAYYNPKTKLVINPLPAIKRKKVKKIPADIRRELDQLEEFVTTLGEKDVTKRYEDWLVVMFGLSYSLGEAGRSIMHKICQNYPDYNKEECDEKYDACLESSQASDNPMTIASVYQLLMDNMPKVQLRQLTAKYNTGHAVGVGEDVQGEKDLMGMVRYKLFLFKKFVDKESNTLLELKPTQLNLNAFEALLRDKGFFRFESMFVWIKDNIVEQVDYHDILRIVTEHIESDGDYNFVYKGVEFHFSWEEIAHLWRQIRGRSDIFNQVSASLNHWQSDLLKDTVDESYIPYLNGVVAVNKKGWKLLPYSDIKKQIWRERILPRSFKAIKTKGMFEEFFENVTAKFKDRALWYFGYMLHCSKRKSLARAWLLYDIKPGNSGRTGKTILGEAIGKIRNVTIIDGKRVDLRNRFAFQTVKPWTDVLFIDDPSKFTSLIPLFNIISGTLDADRKNQDPLLLQLKIMIASNWLLEGQETSEVGRQFVTQLDDFYVRWGKENGDTVTPIVDYHKKEFFTDWDEKDWAQFDSFCVKALQHHLSKPAPGNTIQGNVGTVRFIQQYEEELYHEMQQAFKEHAKEGRDGDLLIAQQLLIEIVKENIEGIKNIKAGRVAREFLLAIGAEKVEITSIVVGGATRMAYKIKGFKKGKK